MELSYLLIFTVGAFLLPGDECFNVTDEYIELAGNFTRIEETPFVAAIFGKDKIFGPLILCMATILSESWLLTSARCYPEDSSGEYLIMTGAPFIHMEKEEHQIDFVIKHGEDSDVNDIALIKTKKPIKFNARQKPISLGNSKDSPRIGDVLTAISFPVNWLTSAEFLRSANVTVIDLDKCVDYVNAVINWNGKFCGTILGKCDGEQPRCNFRAGTIAIHNNRVVGIANYGISTLAPQFFVDIIPLRDWILKYILELEK